MMRNKKGFIGAASLSITGFVMFAVGAIPIALNFTSVGEEWREQKKANGTMSNPACRESYSMVLDSCK